MENVLSITIQDLLEIDSGRGIDFGIIKWFDDGVHVRMNLGWNRCAYIIRKCDIDSNFGSKAFVLNELRYRADELYEKYLEDERKHKEAIKILYEH